MDLEKFEHAITKYGTPLYVFDIDEVKRKTDYFRDRFRESAGLCFAIKANPFLTCTMSKVTDRIEVCSMGEFEICRELQIEAEKLLISGVLKKKEDITEILNIYGGRCRYTVESVEQLYSYINWSSTHGEKINVYLRLTSGNQFGVDEADIRKIISDRTDYPGVEIEGLQFYSGTQKKDLSQMKTELEHLDEFIGELKSESGFEAQVLEYGPGFFVPYFKKDKSEDVENILSEFRALLESLNFKGKVVLEMGRFLAAACGYYVTSIVDMKVNKEQPYVIMDGGINHLNYYGQAMAMKQPYCTQLDTEGNEKTGGEEESWNLCGALCTVSDVVVKRFPLHKPQLHDILVFERVGAYSVTEGIYLFLSRPLPRIYFWTEGEGLRMVRDGVHTDLLNSEK